MAEQRITVVIAEDDELARMLAVEFLTENEVDVVVAEHADAALATLNLQAASVHVLFTDVHMPGPMNGLALAHYVHGHWPWIRILIVSGNITLQDVDMPQGSGFLPKNAFQNRPANARRQMIEQAIEVKA